MHNMEGVNLFEKLKPGQCPYCSGTIEIMISEMNSSILTEDGIPTMDKSEYYRLSGYCLSCNRPLDMIQHGLVFTPYFDKRIHTILYGKSSGWSPTNNQEIIVTKNAFGVY